MLVIFERSRQTVQQRFGRHARIWNSTIFAERHDLCDMIPDRTYADTCPTGLSRPMQPFMAVEPVKDILPVKPETDVQAIFIESAEAA